MRERSQSMRPARAKVATAMVATEATAATQAITAQSMIALDDPERSPQLGSFEGAGGFVWWYL